MKGSSNRSRTRQSALALLAALIAWIVFSVGTARAQTIAEAMDATNLVWTTGGDSEWIVQSTNTHDGVDAVRSGVLSSNQMSWIETTVTGPATVHFWSLTTTNSDSPFLSFVVNPDPSGPTPIPGPGRPGLRGVWSEWTQDLAEGTNVLRWTARNYYNLAGQGYVALDEFNLGPPRPLTFTHEPSDQTVYAGTLSSGGGYGGYFGPGTTLFSAAVIGTPPFQFQWRKANTNLPGANSAWLSFTNVTQADAGNYSLVVSNSQDFIVSTNARLTVLPPTAPFFTYEPESVTAYTGQTLYLSGGVDGSQPFAFQWRKDSTNLPGANSSSLSLTNLSLADGGSYTLFVTNNQGNVESSNAVLTVIQSVAPVITRHPRSLEVAEGVNTWMSVEATGTPDPCHYWKRIGDNPPEPPGPLLPPSPCHQPHRSFNNVHATNAGIYFAAVTNVAGGVVSRDALLTVLPPLSLKSSWGQGAEDVFVANGLAYLAQGTNGLTILNVSNPASPQWLGNYDTAGYASAVRVSGGLAFVADGSSGLQILSVTNPSIPVLIGGYITPGYANGVAVRDHLAYVACGQLLILNVANPASPSVVGSFSTNVSARNVVLSGDSAFIASPYSEILPGTNVAGLVAIDISDPAHPVGAGQIALGVGRMDVRDQLIFGIAGYSLSVISVTNPAEPMVIGTFNNYPSTNFLPHLGVAATDVRVVNDLAYVSASPAGEARLYVVDVRDPTEPIPVGYFSAPGNAGSLWVDGNYAYVAGDSALLIIESPFNPQPVSPPLLSLRPQNGLELQIHGCRGLHYDVEYADSLTGFPWQPFHTIMLTNESAVIEVPSDSNTKFFRLRQLD